ncbi:MAG: hypothetical protein DRP78_02000 [Candidatus Omnitrophota bacterium]|nr:MAG: hypothetical protein DRP78_02000 [Candidatus Omnitrophota bacterium]
MAKIIFVYPPLTSYQRYGHLGKVVGILQPLNLCYLAASTRQAGFATEIIDSSALGIELDEVARLINKVCPEYVGITATTCSINNAGMLARLIKQQNPNITIILGGTHISSLPKETLRVFDGIDIGVIGEGEEVIVDLLNACKKSQDLREVKGIIFRNNGELVITHRQELIENLDSLPMPAWDLLPPFSRYIPSLVRLRGGSVASLVTSRGCNEVCIFCDKSVCGYKIRSHSPEYVINLIRHLSECYRVKEIIFKDPNFTFSKPRVLRFCQQLAESKINIKWNCMVRADTIDHEVLSAMKSCGCWQISVGIESGSQKILDVLKKGICIEQIKDAIEIAKKLKFDVLGYIIIGSPLETEETIKETMEFVSGLRLDSLKVNYFSPYPGSPIYADISKFGIFENNWDQLNAAHPVFIPFGLNEEKMNYFYRKILKDFYFRPRIFLGYLKKILISKAILRYLVGVLGFVRCISKNNEKTY